MCGISGLILKKENALNASEIIQKMNLAIAHRGPDGDGFLLVDRDEAIPFAGAITSIKKVNQLNYFPEKNILNSELNPFLAFGHRRLSILDLSNYGHQPMCNQNGTNWIVFNGEIYNYIELREELKAKGYTFISESDTEVVLAAYQEWNENCVLHFNGMWAFCIYDAEKNICFASRDRLGVKPFYYVNSSNYFGFASEQKAFVKSGLVSGETNDIQLHDYLINGRVEHDENNFFNNVNELKGGYSLIYSLRNHAISVSKYYSTQISTENNTKSDVDLIAEIKNKVTRAVKIRMRSDVEVGTCLSGGLDSSIIAALMTQENKKGIHCFTSVFKGEVFNEEEYANLMANSIGARLHKINPDENSFLSNLNELIYSQDVPIWDTSTFSQFMVMKLAAQHKIKVVLDGQGADELFGGYHHYFIAKWKKLLSEGNSRKAFQEIKASQKTINSPFIFFAKEKLKERMHVSGAVYEKFFKPEFLQLSEKINPVKYFNSVNEQQLYDIEEARLKPFLKCEDRCAMWHSVESRTPFSDDVHLIQLMFSFDGERKIQNGVLKHLFREAFKTELPEKIYKRYDKRGFETPMKKWILNLLPIIQEEIKPLEDTILKKDFIKKFNLDDDKQIKVLFKLFVYSRWKKLFEN
ncbi:MAG: asparagine synthase (glutamine-hydrolyzing) [Sphingobacteriaceae bacterium]|nr:asparagine synthase (glutamine-hydrolyzing) [Sphingobacteriaceae bacterium]